MVFKDYNYGYDYELAKIVAKGDFPDLIYSGYNRLLAGLFEQGALSTAAYWEKEWGAEVTVKGYPGVDGKPVAYIGTPALSIMSTSEVKKGAYEFLEFYLLYMSDEVAELEKRGYASGGLRNILPYAVLEDFSQPDIQNMIWEELVPYFENQMDADTVCEVI